MTTGRLISGLAIVLTGLALAGCVSDPYYGDYRYDSRYERGPRRPAAVYRSDRADGWDRRQPPRVYRDGQRYQPQPLPVYR